MRTHGAPGQGAQRRLTRQKAHTPTDVSERSMHPKTMGFLQAVAKASGTDRPQKRPFYYDDLEDMMFDSMSDSFNTEVEDGSVGEVAKKLFEMHEECLQNNFSSIEKLRNTRPQGNAVSQSRQIATDDDDDSSDNDDEPSMVEDEAARSEDMAVDEPKPSKPTPDADEWTTVPPRHGRGKN
ncbi:hypothetical protein ACQ4PT_035073 [Festuca glaucescens]